MLYSADGRAVRTLIDEANLPRGYYEVNLEVAGNRGRLASGAYFYRVETPVGSVNGRLSVLK
jgi:hypothetical protein